MTSGGLAWRNVGEYRLGRAADIHRLRTPRMERAPPGNVECAGHLAARAPMVIAENPFGIAHTRDRRKERLRIGVRRRCVYLSGGASLDDLPEIHHGHPVRSVTDALDDRGDLLHRW